MAGFNETDLMVLLKTRRKRRSRLGLSCLNELDLSAYADKLVPESQRESIQAHLADCPCCRDRVSFLAKVQNVETSELVPAALLLRARRLAHPPEKQTWMQAGRWRAAGALATCCLLVVALTVHQRIKRLPGSAALTPTSNQMAPGSAEAFSEQFAGSRESRDRTTEFRAPSMLSPLPDSALPPAKMELRWEPVKEAVHYQVCLVTPEGDPVWNYTTDETSVRPPLEVKFTPGIKYFVWVRAYLRDGKIVRSKAVPFSVLDR